MPDLRIAAESMKSTHYLTPRIGLTPSSGLAATLTAPTDENARRREAMTENLFATTYGEDPNEAGLMRVGKFLTAAGVDIVDMIGSAVTPMERGDAWNKMRDWGMDSLANFAQRNESGVGITSGIVATVVTAGLADAYVVPALGARLASSTALANTRLWKLGERVLGGAKQAATNSATNAALQGELATTLGTSGGRALLRARVAEGVGRGVVQEAAVYAVTHTNQEMWSEDASTNLMFAAFGLGIGGALGGVGARYEMRQIANSDEILRLRSQASDPYGYATIREFQPDEAELKALGPGAEYKESTTLTGIMLQARQAAGPDVGPTRARLIEAEAKQAEAMAHKSLQKITTKGAPGIPSSGFSITADASAAAGRHLMDALHKDPTVMLGIDSLAIGDIGKNLITRENAIKAMKKSQSTEEIRLARELEGQENLGLINGSWMPDSKELREMGTYKPGEIKLTPTSKLSGHFEFKVDLSGNRKAIVNEGGNVKDFEKYGFADQLRIYEGLNAVSKRMISNQQTFILPKNPTWLQLDFADNFAKLGGTVDTVTQANLRTMEEVNLASIRAKAAAAQEIVRKKGGIDFWDRAKLNLPLPNSLERIHDGTGDTMVAVLNAAIKNPQITITDLKQIRRQLLEASDLRTGIKTKDPEILGDMFNFNRNQKTGEWQPIVTGFASFNRVNPSIIGSREHLVISTAENKAFRVEKLRSGNFAKGLTENLMALPETQQSMSILGLAADQITGSGNALKQGVGTALTRSMRYRDSAVMLSALRVREVVDRSIEETTNNLVKNVFGDAQNRLASTVSKPSKALTDQWFSYAGGWDLAKGVTKNADGYYVFALAQSARNEQRLGRAVLPGDVLTNPNTGAAIAVDDLGLDYLERFQIAARALLKDTNAVRLSRGLTPLDPKHWYVPPPQTKGMVKGFTVDANGKTVPGGAIIAKSPEEFEVMRKAKDVELAKAGNGHRFFSETEIQAVDDLWELSEMAWVDPGFIGAKKAGQTGSIFSDRMNIKATEESLEWVRDKVKAIGNGTVRSLYDQQLSIARARAAAESTIAGGERRTIYDEWEATILGRPLSGVKPGAGTGLVRKAEEVSQSLINSSWPVVKSLGSVQVGKWLNDLTQRLHMPGVKKFNTFDELAGQLGPYTPYKNAMDFAESTMRVSVPPEVAEITNGINKFAASMLLRWFEFPNAAMNMLGIVTNMPSILRSPSTPVIGYLQSGAGKKIGVIDSYRILAGGFKDMLNPTSHADWVTMLKNGDTSQSIAELNIQASLVHSRTGFQRVMLGDKTRAFTQGKIPANVSELKDFISYKGVDGLVSLAADTTESMSRSWAHFIGLRLADANGIVGTEARHSFARSVANQAIANYNPLNKPELFQTSIGSMFGLFTSYMQQYNQRLFRWMETKEYASVGRQLAMQSTLFGVASVPGYNAIEWLFQSAGLNPNDNPEATLTDAIYAKYGPKVGSVIAHGGVQELPKIFGLDSVALYTRGDANFRSPSLDPQRLMAGLNVVTNMAEGIWELGAQSVSAATDAETSITTQFVTETLARSMPNRAIKGTMQVLFNDGQEIDSSGQIAAETQNWFETSMRMIGLRSGRQQGEIEAYYANASSRRRLAGRMETLREETRSLIRSGKPYEPMEIFNKYVERGGSPTHFKLWIQEQMRAATDSRGMRQFVESLKSPNAQLEAWRYDMRQ